MPGWRMGRRRRRPRWNRSWRRPSTRWRSPALPRSRIDESVTARIRTRAAEAGFDAVGITTVDRIGPELAERLDAFLALGRHGEMRWLEEKAERRRHPNALRSDARSIVALGLNYAPRKNPLEEIGRAHV